MHDTNNLIRLRLPVVGLLLAILAGNIGCVATSTKSRSMMLTTAPPPGMYRILGVTLQDGMVLSFREPAEIARDESGEPVLRGSVPTTHQGLEAGRQVSVPLAEVATFWVESDVLTVVDERAQMVAELVGVAVTAVVIDAIFNWD